jgi:hypothetical protein
VSRASVSPAGVKAATYDAVVVGAGIVGALARMNVSGKACGSRLWMAT